MKLFRTREGDVTAVDTRTQLSTLGSESAPGPLLVPQKAKFLIGVIVAHMSNMAAATSYSAFLRLEGAGLKRGPETMAVGAGGMAVATGGNSARAAKFYPLNLEVEPAQEIQVFGEMAGTDVGLVSMVVTLVFSDAMPAGEKLNRTFTVEGDITTADVRTLLTAQGSVTAPSPVVPADMKTIKRIIVAVASEGLADGAQNFFLRLGGNAVLGGEQVIAIGAVGRIAVQAGSDAAPQIVPATILEDLEIEVSPSDTLSVSVEGAGTDTGTARAVVTLVYE